MRIARSTVRWCDSPAWRGIISLPARITKVTRSHRNSSIECGESEDECLTTDKHQEKRPRIRDLPTKPFTTELPRCNLPWLEPLRRQLRCRWRCAEAPAGFIGSVLSR